MTGPPRASLPPAETQLGERYRLRRLIAEGGMGAVYEAVDEQSDERVAVKLLHPGFTTDAELRRRFRREAAILQTLVHPAIVRMLDVGEQGRLLYMVIEFLEGRTLRERLADEPVLPLGDCVRLATGVAAGLDAAHAHGVLHGDLTPANIFCVDGAANAPVKLLDFALSKVLGLERLTKTGEVSGTIHYLPPELVTGQGRDFDPRIDVYSLGVVLFQCLAGRPPFQNDVPYQLMMSIVTGTPPPLAELAPGLPDAVVAEVERAMHRDPEARHESAGALAEALRRAAEGA